jgi:hypothetical protein
MITIFIRYVLGTLLAAIVAAVYATGFFYTSEESVIIGGISGFALLLIPYLLRASGRPSIRLLLFSLAIATTLIAGIAFNAATRINGNLFEETWQAISEPNWIRYSLPAWGFLLGGSLLVGLILPRRDDPTH